MSDKPTEPDWKAVVQVAIQQRDRAEAKANNLELDLVLAQQREAALQARIAKLVEQRPPAPTLLRPPAPPLKGSKRADAAPG